MDMDGVLVHEETALEGADRFLTALRERNRPFLVLTNNSIYTRRDLAARLRASGLEVPEEAIWTSALATARFLEDQRPGGSARTTSRWSRTSSATGPTSCASTWPRRCGPFTRSRPGATNLSQRCPTARSSPG